MKLLAVSLLLFITNIESNRILPRKLCKDCKHYIAHKKECALFGDIDLVNGNHDYNYAKTARNDKDKCGENAKYFEENNNKIITVPYYFILDIAHFWPFLPLVGLLYIYLDNLYKLYKLTHHE
jgi:hypothetical protein